MKTKSHTFLPAGVLTLAALVAFGGCAGTSVPQTAFTTPDSDDVGSSAEQDRLPEPLSTVKPIYPWQLKRTGVTGLVNIRCLVDETGRVHDPVVVDSTHDMFIKPALDAVQQWTFQPAQQDGQPIARYVRIPIRFKLND